MRVLSANKAAVNCVTFSPDGTRLAAAAHGGAVRVWDLASGTVALGVNVRGPYPHAMRLAFSPDGAHVAATNLDVALVDLMDRTQRWFRTQGFVEAAAFSPDGRWLVGTGYGHTCWDVGTAKVVSRVKAPRGASVFQPTACVFTRDGTRLAAGRTLSQFVGGHFRTVREVSIYDTQTNTVATRLEWAGHGAYRLAFSPDGALLAAACGPVLRVWDVATQGLVAELTLGRLHFLGMAFAPDGRYVATASKDGITRLWSAGSWTVSKVFEWGVGGLLDVAFAPDGTTAAVASEKGMVVLFDVD